MQISLVTHYTKLNHLGYFQEFFFLHFSSIHLSFKKQIIVINSNVNHLLTFTWFTLSKTRKREQDLDSGRKTTQIPTHISSNISQIAKGPF